MESTLKLVRISSLILSAIASPNLPESSFGRTRPTILAGKDSAGAELAVRFGGIGSSLCICETLSGRISAQRAFAVASWRGFFLYKLAATMSRIVPCPADLITTQIAALNVVHSHFTPPDMKVLRENIHIAQIRNTAFKFKMRAHMQEARRCKQIATEAAQSHQAVLQNLLEAEDILVSASQVGQLGEDGLDRLHKLIEWSFRLIDGSVLPTVPAQ